MEFQVTIGTARAVAHNRVGAHPHRIQLHHKWLDALAIDRIATYKHLTDDFIRVHVHPIVV